MSDGQFKIEKEPVQGREETAITMFAGLTMGELLIVIAVAILTLMFGGGGKLVFTNGFLTFVYFRNIKKKIPDRFFSNAFAYYTQPYHIYIASGRDYQWRPPIKH